MILELATFVQLAAACAPRVAPETLVAVAKAESGFDALAINDNTARRILKPASKDEAIALASALLVQRHSLDLGLMQINSSNFPALGLTVATAFEPCRSLAAAERVLLDGYAAPENGQDTQPALHRALSRYNTGDPERGFANGYVTRVRAAAEIVVPAIRLQGDKAAAPALSAGLAPVVAESLPPAWDVYGQARARARAVRAAPAAVTPVAPVTPVPTGEPAAAMRQASAP